jgi:hypothetical protein
MMHSNKINGIEIFVTSLVVGTLQLTSTLEIYVTVPIHCMATISSIFHSILIYVCSCAGM